MPLDTMITGGLVAYALTFFEAVVFDNAEETPCISQKKNPL